MSLHQTANILDYILLHKKHWSLVGAFLQKNTKTYYNRPGPSWSKLGAQHYTLNKK